MLACLQIRGIKRYSSKLKELDASKKNKAVGKGKTGNKLMQHVHTWNTVSVMEYRIPQPTNVTEITRSEVLLELIIESCCSS